MKYDRSEIKAGIFVLISILILLILIFNTGQFREALHPKKELIVKFRHARGIRTNNPVYYAGVYAGKVSNITIDENDDVYLTLQLEDKIKIKRGSEIKITTSVMGESYVDITPGEGPPIENGELVEGTDTNIAEQIQDVVKSINDLLKSEQITSSLENLQKTLRNIASVTETLSSERDKVETILANITTSSENIKDLTQSFHQYRDKIDSILTNVDGTSATIMQNIEKIREKIELVLSNIANMTDEEQIEKIKKITSNILATTENTKKILEENRKSIREIAVNIETITDNLYIMSSDLKRHPWKLIRKSREKDVEKYALQDAIIRLRQVLKDMETLRKKGEQISDEEMEEIKKLIQHFQTIQASIKEREELQKLEKRRPSTRPWRR